MPHPKPDPVAPGQESVWSYPRPAIAEPTSASLRVEFRGRVIASTIRGVRTLETSHPPSYYFPPDDVDLSVLVPAERQTFCEWKGMARYWDVVVGSAHADLACWAYPRPSPTFDLLAGYIAFYPRLMDGCFVDGERAIPQPGGFYGGWITSKVAGPFKGVPGSLGW